MTGTTVHPGPPRAMADSRAAEVLRHVAIRVKVGGENVVRAFAEEFTAEPCFLRAASAFTAALPIDAPVTKVDDFPPTAIWQALDQAVADLEEVRPRSFNRVRRVS